MIANLKPYPACKNSGVPWLGQVPEHWEVRRLKSATDLIMGQSPPSDDCSSEPIGLPFLQGCAEFGHVHPRAKQFCRRPVKVSPVGAILVSVRAPVGRLNVSDQEYGIGRGLCAVVPVESLLSKTFVRYALSVSIDGLAMSSTGSTYDAVSVSDVGSHCLLLPPLPEQSAIVRFLDYMDRRIRRAMRARQKRIMLLEEYKQALIHEAVTGRIDVRTGQPYPAYKNSGIEWLGRVPEHWEVKPVKRYYVIQLGKMLQTKPNTPDDIEVPYLKAQHIHWFSVKLSDVPSMWANAREIQQYGITAGDLLVCEGGEGGRCGIVKEIPVGFIIQNALHRVRPHDHCRNEYLQYVMSVIAKTGWFEALNNKATIAHFTREKFGALCIPIPVPHEQTAIVEYLDAQTAKIDAAIAATRREIELLREYRERLIADVVTGKVDVREVAAQLPEEVEEETEPLEEEPATEEIVATDAEEETHDDEE